MDRSSAGDVLVVGDRWDSLGARLTSIVAAMAVADALGCDFGFVWWERFDNVGYPAREFLASEFCAAFEVTPVELVNRTEVSWRTVRDMTVDEARRHLAGLDGPSVVRMDDPFSVGEFREEAHEDAALRFRAAYERLELAAEPQRLRQLARAAMDGVELAVHARFGDMVIGPWSQFQHRGKFRPAALLDQALANDPADRIVLFSDSDEFVATRSERFDAVTGIVDLVPGYRDLSVRHKSWVDIAALASARRILAPASSAYSRFASHTTGVTITDGLAGITDVERFDVLHSAVTTRPEAETPFFRALRAREIGYLLDSDRGELSSTQRHRLARGGVVLDPLLSGAHSRVAIAAAERGRRRRANVSVQRALETAGADPQWDDPSAGALSAAMVVAMSIRELGDRVVRTAELAEAMALLRPYQLPRVDLVRASRHLSLIAAYLGTRRHRVSRGRIRRRVAPDVWADGFAPCLAELERAAVVAGDLIEGEDRGHSATFRSLRPSSNEVGWFEAEVPAAVGAPAVVVAAGGDRMCAPRAWASSAIHRNFFWLPTTRLMRQAIESGGAVSIEVILTSSGKGSPRQANAVP